MARLAVICVTLGSLCTLPMGLVCACDIRVSSASASFAVRDFDAADSTILRLLPKLVGNSSWIFDVTFSGREFNALEALRVGFVSRVLDSEGEALGDCLKLAEIIAARNPRFVQRSKQALWRIRNIRASKHFLFCLRLRDFSKSGSKMGQTFNQCREAILDILRLKWPPIWTELSEWEV